MPDNEVISITPNNQVLTFSSLQNAKTILLERFHKFIVESPQELARRYTVEQIQEIMRGYKLKVDFFPQERNALVMQIWPQLIMCGRRTTETVFNNKDKSIKQEGYFYLVYRPGLDKAMDIAYLNLPRQAQALIDLAVKVLPREGWPEHKWWKAVTTCDELKTRQDKWRIWMYYSKIILNTGFITTIM